MTDKLRNVLHEQAETVDFAAPDLEAIARTGGRRVRRRRGAALAGGVAAVAVVAGLVIARPGGAGDADDRVAGDPTFSAQVTWAFGSVLHTPDRARDLGHPIRAYVRTRDGIVFTDGQGAVWSYVGGEVTRVGSITANDPRPLSTPDGILTRSITANGPRLVSDPEGSLAGWVDPTGARPTFVVLDQVTGETWRNNSHTSGSMFTRANSARTDVTLYALDGRTAYWHDSRGTVAVDILTGASRGANLGIDILAVQNGLIAAAEGSVTFLGPNESDRFPLPVYANRGVLSPDAAYYSSDAKSGDTDHPEVYDTRIHKRVPIADDYYFASGYEWLDNRTLVLIAQRDKTSPVQLLSCAVPEATCKVDVPDLGSYDDLGARGFTLPVGEETLD